MSEDKIRVVHFADPWCFWSWGLEPLLQRLRVVYGDQLEVVYRMGGVFDDFREWQRNYRVDDQGTSEWIDKAAKTSGNPQNPHYMVQTEVRTSYPSCRAVKAAEKQDAHKAERYFRRLMEIFQIEARAATDENLLQAAADVGLDRDALAADMGTGDIDDAFTADRYAMRTMRVNFLSLVVSCNDQSVGHSGVFAAAPYEKLIDKMAPDVSRHQPTNILEYLATLVGHLVTTREVAEVFQIDDADADARLGKLLDAGLVGETSYDFGRFWLPKSWSAGDQTPDAALVG